MASSNYIVVENYSGLGEMGISRRAIAKIVEKAVGNVKGAKVASGKRFLFAVMDSVRISFASEGLVRIGIDVAVAKGAPVHDVCLSIQEEVASSMQMMVDAVPYDIQVKVVKVA